MYYVQLKHLDFEKVIKSLEEIAKLYSGDTVVLLVHETPDNKCSERQMLIKWFNDHGYELKEYEENVSD